MNLYQIHEGEALAALRHALALHERYQDTVQDILAGMPQHPAAMIASAVDECREEG